MTAGGGGAPACCAFKGVRFVLAQRSPGRSPVSSINFSVLLVLFLRGGEGVAEPSGSAMSPHVCSMICTFFLLYYFCIVRSVFGGFAL